MVNFGPPNTQKIPPKPEKWTSGGQISLLRMSKLHRQIHLSDTARGVKTGGGTWSKPADPGMEIICVAKTIKIIIKQENTKITIVKSKFHIICRIHGGSLLGGFLIRAPSEITHFDHPTPQR